MTMAVNYGSKRIVVGAHYGLLTAQLALALAGKDREEVLSGLVELLSVSRH